MMVFLNLSVVFSIFEIAFNSLLKHFILRSNFRYWQTINYDFCTTFYF